MTDMSPMILLNLEQVVRYAGHHPVYVLAALRKWKHYDPEKCPVPLRAWIEQHYPDVVVEKLAGIELEYELQDNSHGPAPLLSELLPLPIFRVGFNAEQAGHFRQAWSSPPLDTADSPSQFIFMTCDRGEAAQLRGVSGCYVPCDRQPEQELDANTGL